jgi:hypothetical protein
MSSPRLTLLATLSLVLFSASGHLHAGASNKSGNPFGNGTFFQTTGTFSAVVRGENLSGTMIFSTGANTNTSTNSATGSSSGTSTISYLGGGGSPGIYNGNAVGMWDPSSGAISGQLWGGFTLSGSGTTTIYPEVYNTANVGTTILPDGQTTNIGYFPYPIYTVTNSVVNGSNVVSTNVIYVEPVGVNVYNDTAYMSGNFSGNTQNNYPNQTFTAYGTLVEQELTSTAYGGTNTGTGPQTISPISIAITVQGLRISDNYSTFSTVSNSIPYSTTTYTVTNFATF